MSYREIITGQVDRALNAFFGNDAGNAPTLMMLGGFKFSLNTAVFQQVHRSASMRWSAQERVGQIDALQCTGPGEERITLPGIVYPDFRGGAGQIDSLRSIMFQKKPVRLIAANGDILGLWVIESVDETASEFKPDGTPRKQEFNVTIRKFQDADV